MKRIWIVVIIVVGIIVIAAVGYFGFLSTKPEEETIPQSPDTTIVDYCDVEQSVTAPGSVTNTDVSSILMPVDGYIEKIIIRPGDNVKTGDKLAELIKDPVELAKAQVALTDALIKLSEAKKKIAGLKYFTYYPPEKIEVAYANLALAQATVDKAQIDLDTNSNGFIVSPFDGIILESKAETQKKTTAGTYLFSIHSPSNIEVAVTVVEEDLLYVKVGQKVDLFFEALPDAETSGVVSRILPKRASTERSLYPVYIKLDNIPNNLLDGMTADAAIEIAKRDQVLCLPRAIVLASSGETAIVKVWNGLKTEERKIKIGLRGDTYLEILSGLEKGEQVVTQ